MECHFVGSVVTGIVRTEVRLPSVAPIPVSVDFGVIFRTLMAQCRHVYLGDFYPSENGLGRGRSHRGSCERLNVTYLVYTYLTFLPFARSANTIIGRLSYALIHL